MEKKTLLFELRMFEINPVEKITNESLTKAITVNAEINNLGFTMLPKDIIRLASDAHPENLLKLIQEMYNHKGYKPMYPGFPEEVLEMDEAVYRFHQLLHYFTTYGIEQLTGKEVSEGWMPSSKYEEKEGEAERLKELTVIELATKEEISNRIEKYIIQKKERWTQNEAILAGDFFAEHLIDVYEIPFKENIFVYYDFLKSKNDLYILLKLKQVCQHSGDVLDLISLCVEDMKYNHLTDKAFKTSERRLFSKLLDLYSEKDLSENLIRAEARNKIVLNYISYNKYSRNPMNKEVVRKFRNDELRSWKSIVEEKIKNHSEDTLDFIAKRPGEYFRSIRRLLSLGYSEEEILSHIKGADLKVQTIVSALNSLCNIHNDAKVEEKAYKETFVSIAKTLLVEALSQHKTPLSNKKVFFDKTQYSPEHSILSIDKADEGGYIRSGLAFAVPENVDTLREFVFWNDDSKRVDVDLHSVAFEPSGRSVHIGWNRYYSCSGVTMSGDITTSKNSAEYIDVDIEEAKNSNIENVTFLIDYFNGGKFNNIEKCYFGIVAAKKDSDTSLYDPKNLYFHHDLTKSNKKTLDYGVFNLTNRTLRLLSEKETVSKFVNQINFSLMDYLQLLAKAQNFTFVDRREEADIVVTLDKQENTYCLIDKNFLLEGDKEYENELKICVTELEDNQVKYVGPSENCNKLLKEYSGCMGFEDGQFFWLGTATKEDVLSVVEG